MVACPFDVPKFEYDSPNPRIRKCVLCWEKLRLGQAPACAAACPAEALRFGSRAGLIETAWRRIYDEPDRYVHHVCGEREAGGTLVLYLSAVPFAQLGLPANLGETPYPEHTRDFLYAVPFTLTLVPPFLLALSRASQARRAAEETAEGEN